MKRSFRGFGTAPVEPTLLEMTSDTPAELRRVLDAYRAMGLNPAKCIEMASISVTFALARQHGLATGEGGDLQWCPARGIWMNAAAEAWVKSGIPAKTWARYEAEGLIRREAAGR
jgi:hypothetical protein